MCEAKRTRCGGLSYSGCAGTNFWILHGNRYFSALLLFDFLTLFGGVRLTRHDVAAREGVMAAAVVWEGSEDWLTLELFAT